MLAAAGGASGQRGFGAAHREEHVGGDGAEERVGGHREEGGARRRHEELEVEELQDAEEGEEEEDWSPRGTPRAGGQSGQSGARAECRKPPALRGSDRGGGLRLTRPMRPKRKGMGSAASDGTCRLSWVANAP
eukprot:4721327-Prymnesium_polylepis.1